VKRLNALDAEFLHLEDGIVHMHIAGATVFGDPPPAFHEMEALVASKLHLIPRYRQRVRSVPFELGRPVWVDDPVGAENPIHPVQATSLYSWMSPPRTSVRRMPAVSGSVIGTVSVTPKGHC